MFNQPDDTAGTVDEPIKEHKAPEEHADSWENLMKQGASGLGGGQPQGDTFRPAFGSGNTVQSGGFGKYRSAIMGLV